LKHRVDGIADQVAQYLTYFTVQTCYGPPRAIASLDLDSSVHHLSEFTGQHLFHLTAIAAHWHPSESGDITMNWIQGGLFLILALVGGVVWTLIALLRNNRRTEYRTLNSWLRFLLRLTRTPTPAHYPLLERGFHFINEWRYER